jgi:hypothetical protein
MIFSRKEPEKKKSSKKYSFIFESNKTNYINLDNMNTEDTIVVGQLTVDTKNNSKAKIQIGLNCQLDYTVSLTEQMNLLFTLFRKDSHGIKTELTSVPYTVNLTGELGTEAEFITISLEKNETFTMNYLDEITVGELYTYFVEVNLIYSSVDASSIQSGTITAIGKAFKNLY